jgi:sugar diacid utilization regulator
LHCAGVRLADERPGAFRGAPTLPPVTAAKVEPGVAGSLADPVASLVRTAVESDAPEQLVALAQQALRKPLGLVGPAGEALGRAPASAAGDRALAIARAAATNRLVAPPGWWIVDVARAGSSPFGYLAVGDRDGDAEPSAHLVELVSTLLADQLQRVALLRGRTSELLRRLVSDTEVGPARARREAKACGLALADAYWPAILGWRGRPPRPEVADAIEREAREASSGALSVVVTERTVLLHPRDGGNALDWFRRVAAGARRLAPGSRPQVIVGERELGLAELGTGVGELEALWEMGPRAEDDQPLVSVRHYALDRFLARTADSPEATEFVRQQIGPLIAWDRQHHGDLLTVLEAGLDAPRHELAAARCFMHRNTFRNRLRLATRALGDGLEDPDVRLATHVALKLRRTLGTFHDPPP